MQLILIFESASTYNIRATGSAFDANRFHSSVFRHPTYTWPAALHALPVDPGHARQRRLQPAGVGRGTGPGQCPAHGRLPLRHQPAAAGVGAQRLYRGDRLASGLLCGTCRGRRLAGRAWLAETGSGPAAPAGRHRPELPHAQQRQRGDRTQRQQGHRPAANHRQRHP
ncbi:hypothetical protein D3C81_1060780 [compost metagenome]